MCVGAPCLSVVLCVSSFRTLESFPLKIAVRVLTHIGSFLHVLTMPVFWLKRYWLFGWSFGSITLKTALYSTDSSSNLGKNSILLWNSLHNEDWPRSWDPPPSSVLGLQALRHHTPTSIWVIFRLHERLLQFRGYLVPIIGVYFCRLLLLQLDAPALFSLPFDLQQSLLLPETIAL